VDDDSAGGTGSKSALAVEDPIKRAKMDARNARDRAKRASGVNDPKIRARMDARNAHLRSKRVLDLQDEATAKHMKAMEKKKTRSYRRRIANDPERLPHWKEMKAKADKRRRDRRRKAAPPVDQPNPALHLPEPAGPSLVPLTEDDINRERLWLLLESSHSPQYEVPPTEHAIDSGHRSKDQRGRRAAARGAKIRDAALQAQAAIRPHPVLRLPEHAVDNY
jgi:hypothetical protein